LRWATNYVVRDLLDRISTTHTRTTHRSNDIVSGSWNAQSFAFGRGEGGRGEGSGELGWHWKVDVAGGN
jgi:hypothetical protein